MMSGVRASSIRMESTSSTMAKTWPRWAMSSRRAGHVVAQVVEAELVVGAVGDVRRVGGPLEDGVVDVGTDAADGEPEPAVDAAHPLGVAGGQVLVDRHHVHAPPVEGVEVGGERGDEGLALAGLHLGDPAEVQRHAAHELDVEVALARAPARPPRAPRRRPRSRRSSRRLALVEALLELDRLVGERVVAQALHLGLEGADERHQLGQPPDLLALAGAQDLREHAHGGPILPAAGPAPSRQARRAVQSGCVRLTWSLTPHSPAARVTRRHRRPGGCRRTQRHHAGAHRLVSARPRQPGTRRAGLTSKPHHAQRPQVALRGSFRLRLASTFNHRPARSPPHMLGRRRRDCPGHRSRPSPTAVPALAGVAPSSTVTCARSSRRRPRRVRCGDEADHVGLGRADPAFVVGDGRRPAARWRPLSKARSGKRPGVDSSRRCRHRSARQRRSVSGTLVSGIVNFVDGNSSNPHSEQLCGCGTFEATARSGHNVTQPPCERRNRRGEGRNSWRSAKKS